jgi:actin-like ATPase involved in cell morphogenesis
VISVRITCESLETASNSSVADEPLLCVVKGTGEALNHLETYKKSILIIKNHCQKKMLKYK